MFKAASNKIPALKGNSTFCECSIIALPCKGFHITALCTHSQVCCRTVVSCDFRERSILQRTLTDSPRDLDLICENICDHSPESFINSIPLCLRCPYNMPFLCLHYLMYQLLLSGIHISPSQPVKLFSILQSSTQMIPCLRILSI